MLFLRETNWDTAVSVIQFNMYYQILCALMLMTSPPPIFIKKLFKKLSVLRDFALVLRGFFDRGSAHILAAAVPNFPVFALKRRFS